MSTLPVKTQVIRHAGIITLDRPKALNALDMAMIEMVGAALDEWLIDDNVKLIVLRHSGGATFCAGGDVRVLWKLRHNHPEHRVTNDYFAASYFRAEYVLNHRLKFYPKPIIAFIDGLTMGGGVGLTSHCSHVVATENTQWAMPETAIGFVPDVGSSYILSRMPDHIGEYLATTGARIDAASAVYLGVAQLAMESARVADAITKLTTLNVGVDANAAVTRALKEFTVPPPAPDINIVRRMVGSAFSHDKIEKVLFSLSTHGDFGQETTEILMRLSPLAVKLAHQQIREARKLSFNNCLRLEYRLCQACLGGHDFYEGVRALLIDKDKKPVWSPGSFQDITPDMIQDCFHPNWDTKNGYFDLPSEPDAV